MSPLRGLMLKALHQVVPGAAEALDGVLGFPAGGFGITACQIAPGLIDLLRIAASGILVIDGDCRDGPAGAHDAIDERLDDRRGRLSLPLLDGIREIRRGVLRLRKD